MSSPKKAEQQAKIKFWQPHVTAWQRSGLTAVGYCKKHSLNQWQFKYWQYQIAPHTKGKSTKKSKGLKFIEVTPRLNVMTNSTTIKHAIEVKTPAGYCLNIPSNFDEATLFKLLTVLRGAAC